MKNTQLKLNVQETLSFFDDPPVSCKGHATAIVGVIGEDLGISLFQSYLHNERNIKTTVLLNKYGPITPTLGTKNGHRLDRWLAENAERNNKRYLYQVEIKNWSAHAIGGKSLSLLADRKNLEIYRRQRWGVHWDVEYNRFKSEKVAKVLEPMSVPKGYENAYVVPVICFWEAIHPEGKSEPLFDWEISKTKKTPFKSLMVFSMSNYLRSLKEKNIEIEMPTAIPRIGLIHKLVNLV